MTTPGQLTDASAAVRFMLAGRAKVTLVSQKTQTRFTYKINQPADEVETGVHFVSVLQGPDNNADYGFLGTIFSRRTYRHGTRSKISPIAPSEMAFDYSWRRLIAGDMPPLVEVWHEGVCGRCGRSLTVPSSIALGLGPECAEKGG